jgi:hypothetical protein
MRYGIAVPEASPTDTPVSRRPASNPGRSFQATSNAADAIIVATAASITPLRPVRAAIASTLSNVVTVPAAKIA